jgi:anthranilate phosphoribosyltransferase
MKDLIAKLVARESLDAASMEQAMDAVLRGEATQAQIAALLVALRMKGETAGEIAAAARAMRRHAVPVSVQVDGAIMDTCGTGGDGAGSFNISTVAAIVVAACGVTVAKHGNRAASSQAGSADVLEALGVDVVAAPERIARCIEQVGIGFMFARAHHPAMKHVAGVRAELGVRTLFNFLGPLANPAGATHQLLGVGDGERLEIMAEVLCVLGTQAAWVVHGHGGLDEVSLSGPTRVAEVRGGSVRCFEVGPADFGVARAELAALRGGDAAHNASLARAILAGERGPKRDAVVVNAAAALCAVGVADTPALGARMAAEALDDGRANAKLAAWVAFSG